MNSKGQSSTCCISLSSSLLVLRLVAKEHEADADDEAQDEDQDARHEAGLLGERLQLIAMRAGRVIF
jgi:hypothetical protein